MIANCLIGIDAATPTDLRPVIRPLLARIMRHEQEADRLRSLEISLLKDASDAKLKTVQDELASIESEIEKMEIQAALGRLCQAENLDPSLVITGLLDRCRFDDSGLTILDRHGVPVSFERAVRELGGES